MSFKRSGRGHLLQFKRFLPLSFRNQLWLRAMERPVFCWAALEPLGRLDRTPSRLWTISACKCRFWQGKKEKVNFTFFFMTIKKSLTILEKVKPVVKTTLGILKDRWSLLRGIFMLLNMKLGHQNGGICWQVNVSSGLTVWFLELVYQLSPIWSSF